MKHRYYCSICIFLLICLLFGCTQASSTPPSSSETPSAERPSGELSVVQIYNIIKDYDYWYYALNGRVTAFKGDEEISLKGESIIRDIQFADGWIYYVKDHSNFSGGFDIFRVRPNGEDASVFFNSDELQGEFGNSFQSLTFADGYMYIHSSLVLYQYDMSTKTIKQIGDVAAYHIIDKKLYFISHIRKDATVYVLDLETEETKLLLGDGINNRDKKYPKLYYRDFIFIGDIMYYTKCVERSTDDYFIELFRYENGESTLIDGTDNYREFSLFEYDGKLCYIVWEDEVGKVMQYNPENGQKTEILTCSDYRSGAAIKNGYFYYLNSEYQLRQIHGTALEDD